MSDVGQFNIILNKKMVKEARELLEVGQKFSPVVNRLIELWILDKLLSKKRKGKTPKRKEHT